MSKVWYLREYEDKTYLHNAVLYAKEYSEEFPNHDHCELCWARFSQYPEDHHIGYYDANNNIWICTECFQEFSSLFGWTEKKQ